ncbi:hypothetical protein DIURU_002683 [Diutina rugosa]|uniref:Zn(2)-C6 fungal-type domain-containing protein n=1 Tax=Diutina rugosa TaxID=5481 RepID=A0A642UR11_DIURU|nr:uncharacterized protein DIURU_002683 [Diutina rugosa]KAA8902787.1 hypothetical protein DIURU_002683 [Diutina rugosa]
MARRKHENSHFGCATCKKRKVKCDETYPQCLCCVRYKQQCPFSQLSPEEIAERMEQKRLNQIKKNNRKNRRPRKSRAAVAAQAPPTPEVSRHPSYDVAADPSGWSSPPVPASLASSSSSSSSISTWPTCSPLLSSEADTISPVPASSPSTAPLPTPEVSELSEPFADTPMMMMPAVYPPQYPTQSYPTTQLYPAEWADAAAALTIPDPESPPVPAPAAPMAPMMAPDHSHATWPSALEAWLFDDLDMPAYPATPPAVPAAPMAPHAQALADFGISVAAPVATPSW